MAQTVNKIEVWTCEIEDRAGTLDAKLQPLAGAGVDLTFALARRQADRPGRSIVYLGPLKGPRQIKAAESAGFRLAHELVAVHFEGPNKPGSASKITHALAEAGINMRGLMAATIGKKYMLVLAFDSNEQAEAAIVQIKEAGKKKAKKKK